MTEEEIQEKTLKYTKEVLESEEFKAQIKYLNNFSFDFINAIREIVIYSERAPHIYSKQIINSGFDDLIQSVIGILSLVNGGIHNTVKRELRYLLEMTVKYLVVDQECSKADLNVRIEYLNDNIPRSSINVIDRATLPFDESTNVELKSEIKSIFSELSTFVHPSKGQLDAQLANYNKGNYIGFESLKVATRLNKIVFRGYDLILTMLFTGFGNSMSADLFTELYTQNEKWKFYKGKYISKYSKLVK